MTMTETVVANHEPDRRRKRAAERELIGALLLGGLPAFDRIASTIKADSLSESRHRPIFAAITALASRRMPIDALTVIDELERAGKLRAAGGDDYLAQMLEQAGSAANIEAYARIVTDVPAGEALKVSSEPEPLRRPLPPAEPYPIDALGPVLGAAAHRIHAVVRAPDAIVGQSILAAASLAAQPHADVLIDGRREPLSLWCLTVAESGERKSAADAHALAPHREHERIALGRFRDTEREHAIALDAHDAAARACRKGKGADEIEARLRELGTPPDKPRKPLMLASSPTLEGLHLLFRDGQPSLGLFHDDAGEFLAGHSMDKDHKMRSAAGLSKLHDRGEFDRIRAADGASKYFGRRLAMHLMVQPVVAESVLSDEVLTGQGFLARALLAWPSSAIGTRAYVATDLSTDPAMLEYRKRIDALLQLPPKIDDDGALTPQSLTLDSRATARWIALHDAIEADMRDGGDFSSIRAWAAKAPAQVLRIAGVLTIVDDPGASSISLDTIDRAATLVLFALGEAVRIVGHSSVPAEIRHAEALLDWAHTEKLDLLYSSKALRLGPACIRHRRAFDAAIAELERAGWAAAVDGGSFVDGAHRRRVWRMTGPQA